MNLSIHKIKLILLTAILTLSFQMTISSSTEYTELIKLPKNLSEESEIFTTNFYKAYVDKLLVLLQNSTYTDTLEKRDALVGYIETLIATLSKINPTKNSSAVSDYKDNLSEIVEDLKSSEEYRDKVVEQKRKKIPNFYYKEDMDSWLTEVENMLPDNEDERNKKMSEIRLEAIDKFVTPGSKELESKKLSEGSAGDVDRYNNIFTILENTLNFLMEKPGITQASTFLSENKLRNLSSKPGEFSAMKPIFEQMRTSGKLSVATISFENYQKLLSQVRNFINVYKKLGTNNTDLNKNVTAFETLLKNFEKSYKKNNAVYNAKKDLDALFSKADRDEVADTVEIEDLLKILYDNDEDTLAKEYSIDKYNEEITKIAENIKRSSDETRVVEAIRNIRNILRSDLARSNLRNLPTDDFNALMTKLDGEIRKIDTVSGKNPALMNSKKQKKVFFQAYNVNIPESTINSKSLSAYLKGELSNKKEEYKRENKVIAESIPALQRKFETVPTLALYGNDVSKYMEAFSKWVADVDNEIEKVYTIDPKTADEYTQNLLTKFTAYKAAIKGKATVDTDVVASEKMNARIEAQKKLDDLQKKITQDVSSGTVSYSMTKGSFNYNIEYFQRFLSDMQTKYITPMIEVLAAQNYPDDIQEMFKAQALRALAEFVARMELETYQFVADQYRTIAEKYKSWFSSDDEKTAIKFALGGLFSTRTLTSNLADIKNKIEAAQKRLEDQEKLVNAVNDSRVFTGNNVRSLGSILDYAKLYKSSDISVAQKDSEVAKSTLIENITKLHNSFMRAENVRDESKEEEMKAANEFLNLLDATSEQSSKLSDTYVPFVEKEEGKGIFTRITEFFGGGEEEPTKKPTRTSTKTSTPSTTTSSSAVTSVRKKPVKTSTETVRSPKVSTGSSTVLLADFDPELLRADITTEMTKLFMQSDNETQFRNKVKADRDKKFIENIVDEKLKSAEKQKIKSGNADLIDRRVQLINEVSSGIDKQIGEQMARVFVYVPFMEPAFDELVLSGKRYTSRVNFNNQYYDKILEIAANDIGESQVNNDKDEIKNFQKLILDKAKKLNYSFESFKKVANAPGGERRSPSEISLEALGLSGKGSGREKSTITQIPKSTDLEQVGLEGLQDLTNMIPSLFANSSDATNFATRLQQKIDTIVVNTGLPKSDQEKLYNALLRQTEILPEVIKNVFTCVPTITIVFNEMVNSTEEITSEDDFNDKFFQKIVDALSKGIYLKEAMDNAAGYLGNDTFKACIMEKAHYLNHTFWAYQSQRPGKTRSSGGFGSGTTTGTGVLSSKQSEKKEFFFEGFRRQVSSILDNIAVEDKVEFFKKDVDAKIQYVLDRIRKGGSFDETELSIIKSLLLEWMRDYQKSIKSK